MCTPSYPCRVGIIRKLRLDATLKKKPDGSWKIDLSKQRDGHKTSRFYGPFAASLPSELNDILDKYTSELGFDGPVDGGAYLFHPPRSKPDRPMESSAWSGWVKRCFKRHAGEEIAPKTLRSIFITCAYTLSSLYHLPPTQLITHAWQVAARLNRCTRCAQGCSSRSEAFTGSARELRLRPTS